MLPAHAPLPTASSLPFHPEAGSQTSILMSESLDGVSVAATRQNTGSPPKAVRPLAPRPGATNVPAPTVCANVIATGGCDNADRLSQVAPIAGAAIRTNAIASFMTAAVFVGRPFQGRLFQFFQFFLILGIHRLRAAHGGVERQLVAIQE